MYASHLRELRDIYRVWESNQLSRSTEPTIRYQEVSSSIEEAHSQAAQDALHRLDKAFKAFFRRMKSGAKVDFPRF